MWESIQAYEPVIRLSVFLGIFALMALWELLAPRRSQTYSRLKRWPSNFGIVVFNTLVLRVLFPTAAVGMAMAADANGWGLFNTVQLPAWLILVLTVLIMDFTIYLQHVLVHAVPVLWRIHRMHHSDLEFDVTTGSRFHPVEIAISMVIKLVVVGALGAPALAVLIFEVILNASAMFNHANVRIPKKVDRILRWLIVTPDMHRVHHSIIPSETNSNFGFNLPWWDHLFGTYTDQPEGGHEGMTIGIAQFRHGRELWLDRMLLQPLRGKVGDYAINRKTPSAKANK